MISQTASPVSDHPPQTISRWLVAFMAASAGLIVANIYYVQPLLSDIAAGFRISTSFAGGVAMTSQIGTAFGMLLFVPLGDSVERRGLILRLVSCQAGFLLLAAISPSSVLFALAGAGIGLTGASVHVFVPFAAHLAPPATRGKVVGTVLSGLLVGILLARTFSGWVGAAYGWRAVYFLGCGIMLILVGLIKRFLPENKPSVKMPYGELLKSVVQLSKEHQPLREAALAGATLFCVFSAFWTALVFLLQTPPYHYGSEVAGTFGLVGAAGALGAPVVGRLADRYSARSLVMIAVGIVFFSYVIFAFWGRNMTALIFAVLTLDFGVQAGHVANQSRIYALNQHARSRLNTFYMVSYFLGGALGSLASGFFWQHFGWVGVCAFSLMMLTGLGAYLAATTIRLSLRKATGS